MPASNTKTPKSNPVLPFAAINPGAAAPIIALGAATSAATGATALGAAGAGWAVWMGWSSVWIKTTRDMMATTSVDAGALAESKSAIAKSLKDKSEKPAKAAKPKLVSDNNQSVAAPISAKSGLEASAPTAAQDNAPATPKVEAEASKVAKAEPGATAKPKITARPMALDGPKHGKADDLKLISGVGPKLEIVLNDLGIYHFDQVASWTRPEIEWVDDYLKFSGRIERDDWVSQAAALARGGAEEYIRVFGKAPR
jgi:predicted flap endonuclease-1-like 5' DNA nuclease